MKLHLVKPSPVWKQEAISMKQEFFAHQEFIMDGSDLWDQMDSYEAWLASLKRNEHEATCDRNWVVSFTWLAILDQKVVGIIDFRPQLNDSLRNIGHIGYSTRPSMRKKGIAKEMLRQVLQKAEQKQLAYVTISCFHDNIASARVILASGGIYVTSFYYQDRLADCYHILLPAQNKTTK